MSNTISVWVSAGNPLAEDARCVSLFGGILPRACYSVSLVTRRMGCVVSGLQTACELTTLGHPGACTGIWLRPCYAALEAASCSFNPWPPAGAAPILAISTGHVSPRRSPRAVPRRPPCMSPMHTPLVPWGAPATHWLVPTRPEPPPHSAWKPQLPRRDRSSRWQAPWLGEQSLS